MAFEHKENKGSLFPPSDKAPASVSLSGEINVAGSLYYITIWKKDKPDQKHWNVTVKPKQSSNYQEPPRQEPETRASGPYDDEVPF